MLAASQFGIPDDGLTELVLPNDLRAAREPGERILRELQRNHYAAEVVFAIKLALEEALTNAIKHGNRGDKSKRLWVRYFVDPQRVLIMVRDQGQGFRPGGVPDCTADENLERPSGRGIMLMHAYMTRICYNDEGNEVWMYRENRDHPSEHAQS